jgi:ABC-2 type transport system permease protein
VKDEYTHMLKAIWAICWKDIKLYYAKGPIVVTGILFPIFLWIAFYAGKGLELKEGLASLITMTLLFTASSVTPIIAPWETRQRTLEMLLSRPITVRWVLIGDILASTIFGTIFVVPLMIIGVILNVTPANPFLTLIVIILTAVGLSSLGVIFSAFPTDTPADAVLLSSSVKLPLMFVSGVLVPITQLPSWIIPITMISPITYPTDFLRMQYLGTSFLQPYLSLAVTTLFTLVFAILALKLHEKTVLIRLQRR